MYAEVRAQTSATSLAAIAIFSGYDRNLSRALDIGRSVDFYAPWDGSGSSRVKPWINGRIPRQLFVVVDKGRFEFRIPRLFPNTNASLLTIDDFVFRNVFMHKDKAVYLKGMVVECVEMRC